MQIIQATPEHLGQLVPLFDAYRVFYHQATDVEGARLFLLERMQKAESVVFLALDEATPGREVLGFVQLYPSFSSVSLRRLWILNDLFVDSEARKRGVATRLIERAHQLAIETGAKGVLLETHPDNLTARRLYESIGFNRVSESYYYFRPVRK